MEALVRYFAVALAGRGINVNIVSPGWIEDSVLNSQPEVFQTGLREWQERGWTPMGRLGTPADIGKAVALICSSEASWITGQLIEVRQVTGNVVSEAHHRVPPAGFKYLVTEMVCWATGGPQPYTGKSMADSHAHLKITATEWQAFLDDFQQTLEKFALPSEEQAELKAIVNSTRPDIVTPDAAVA